MFVSLTKNLAWSDEQTRFYLQLRIDEKLKGNIRKQNVNDAGRQSIIDKFYEAYGERHPWKIYYLQETVRVFPETDSQPNWTWLSFKWEHRHV